MNEYAGVSQWMGGIPVELPVDAVRRYVQGENITHERFNLLKDYFEGRIIKLLEHLDCEKNGNPNHDTHDCLYYQTADSLIALIKGENE